LEYEDLEILKKKFLKVILFIQFFNGEKNINQQNDKNEIILKEFTTKINYYEETLINNSNIYDNALFELLQDISDNKILYQYCLGNIIEQYNSKTKEFYFDIDKSNDPKNALDN
jgi:hypothetical protein